MEELRNELKEEEKSRISEIVSARQDLERQLHEDIESCIRSNQDAWKAISTEEANKREETIEGIRSDQTRNNEEQRGWIKVLIDKLFGEMRAEQEAMFSEQRRRSEELANEAAEKVRLQVLTEVSKVENSTKQQLRVQEM